MYEQSKYLQAAHLFFDFSWARWRSFWQDPAHPCPFQSKVFVPWRNLKIKIPRHWNEALQVSAQYNPKWGNRVDTTQRDYPEGLRMQSSPPPVLYIKGSPTPTFSALVAIVGTRKVSAFGKVNTTRFSKFFSSQNIGIVSGLARGVDSIAHKTCLDHNGYALAVLGSGFQHLYPKENSDLFERILESNGTVVTQFPPWVRPHQFNFPRRNHLIAAMSAGTILIEGPPKSGAAITAKITLDQSKTVVVLTQNYCDSYGEGAIELIRIGATPVATLQQAYEAISLPYGGKLDPLPPQKNSKTHEPHLRPSVIK